MFHRQRDRLGAGPLTVGAVQVRRPAWRLFRWRAASTDRPNISALALSAAATAPPARCLWMLVRFLLRCHRSTTLSRDRAGLLQSRRIFWPAFRPQTAGRPCSPSTLAGAGADHRPQWRAHRLSPMVWTGAMATRAPSGVSACWSISRQLGTAGLCSAAAQFHSKERVLPK